MKCRRLVTLLAAVLTVVASACQTSPVAAPPTLVIASDLPTSSPMGTASVANAIAFAISLHPTIGPFRLQYIPLDDALGGAPSAMLGVENVKHMVNDTRVMGMIGPWSSYVTWDEIPRANQAQLVMLSPSSTNSCVTAVPSCTSQMDAINRSGKINFFRLAAPDYKQGTAMGRFAASLGIRRVAVVNEWGSTGDLVAKRFAQELAAVNGAVVFRQDLDTDETKFTTFLQGAKAAGADTIYALAPSDGNICLLGPQMKSDFKYLLTNDFAFGNDSCIAATVAPSTKVYLTFADVDPTHSTDKRARDLVALFKKSYPQDKYIQIYTFAAYDCALILIDAIEQVIKENGGVAPKRSQVLAAVASGHFSDGVTGTYSFDAHGEAISPLMAIWTATDGKWTYLKQADAGPDVLPA